MSEVKQKVKYWSCPWCFSKGIDSAGLKERKDGVLYCVRCCFTGDEELVRETYRNYQKKYKLLEKRLKILD